jgi:secretion/DNA translocation related TadE-like protein
VIRGVRAPRAGRGERGSATIWVLAVGGLVVTVGLVGALVGAAVTGRHRAQVAADLGALAGARYAASGQATACARAAVVVRANGASLGGCLLDGLDLVVTAEVTVRGVGVARARARAGPVA